MIGKICRAPQELLQSRTFHSHPELCLFFMVHYICPLLSPAVFHPPTPVRNKYSMSASLTSAIPIATSSLSIPPDIARMYVNFSIAFNDGLILP